MAGCTAGGSFMFQLHLKRFFFLKFKFQIVWLHCSLIVTSVAEEVKLMLCYVLGAKVDLWENSFVFLWELDLRWLARG